jgi:hypothetical protein
MLWNPVAQWLTFCRARWRWAHGHCPRCNHNLYATFPNDVAGCPDCPVCKDESAKDLRMGLWGGLADLPAEAGLLSDREFPPVETHR